MVDLQNGGAYLLLLTEAALKVLTLAGDKKHNGDPQRSREQELWSQLFSVHQPARGRGSLWNRTRLASFLS